MADAGLHAVAGDPQQSHVRRAALAPQKILAEGIVPHHIAAGLEAPRTGGKTRLHHGHHDQPGPLVLQGPFHIPLPGQQPVQRTAQGRPQPDGKLPLGQLAVLVLLDSGQADPHLCGKILLAQAKAKATAAQALGKALCRDKGKPIFIFHARSKFFYSLKTGY